MKMADAAKMVPWILKWEGGYVNDKDDAGGCTCKGITIGTFRRYYGVGKTCDDLNHITNAQWYHIFKTGYWDKVKADYIGNQSIAELCTQMVWGSGARAIYKIQSCLGVRADGVVGEKTLAALNADDSEATFKKLWEMRKRWLMEIAMKGNNRKYLKGWLNRLNDLKYRAE